MATLNKKTESIYTAEGAKAKRILPELQLRRSVMSCLLWENEFYEDGETISKRIIELCKQVSDSTIAEIAIEAREKQNLRHIPLLLVREMTRNKSKLVAETLLRVIQRADELTEFLAIYWQNGRCSLSAQVKKGLAKAFLKFNEYHLAKYNRDNAIKLRDVLFLCHAKPDTPERAELWKKLVEDTLQTPDTWEVELSAGKNKKETFERLISENKIGAMAFLRNLRNMQEAGVSEEIVFEGLSKVKTERVLPFRFISAAKHAPKWESKIEPIMFKNLQSQVRLSGKTIFVVDVSGSMYGTMVSAKSEITRAEAGCALAVLIREISENPVIYATGGNDLTRIHKTQVVPDRRGFALKDAIYNLRRPLGGGGIFLNQVVNYIKEKEQSAERIIVITDEQDCAIDPKDSPLKVTPFGKYNYMINVASNKNGVGYGRWTHIDGWSESIVNYIIEFERSFGG